MMWLLLWLLLLLLRDLAVGTADEEIKDWLSLSLPWGVIWHPYQSGSIVAVGHCITSCLKTDFLCLPTTSKSLEMNVFVLPKPSWNTTSGRNRHQQNKFYGRRKVNQPATKLTQQDDTEAIGKSQLDWGPTSIQDTEISKIHSSVWALGRLEHSLSCFANSPESSLSHFCLPCSFSCISPSSFKTECRGSCILTKTFTCDLMKFVSPLHDHRGWLNIIYK